MNLYAVVHFNDFKDFIEFFNARKDTQAILDSLEAHKGIVRFKFAQDEAQTKFENAYLFEGDYCVLVHMLIDEFGTTVTLDGARDSKETYYYI